jgi:hypothetical protein
VQEIEGAIEQAMVEAGLPPDSESLDFQAFMRMLNADMNANAAGASQSIQRFASMRQRTTCDRSSSLSGVLRDTMIDACNSCSLRRRSIVSGPLAEDVWETLMSASGSRRSTEHLDTRLSNLLLNPAARQASRDVSIGLATGSLGTVQEEKESVHGAIASSSNVFVPTEYEGGAGGGGDGRVGTVGGGYEDFDGHNNDEEGRGRGYASKTGKAKKLEGMFSEGSVGHA